MNKNTITGFNKKIDIVEKRLKIAADYQYKALNNSNFIQSNWHANKLYILEKYLDLNKKSRVLDLGTGSGNFELQFGEKVKEIFGVDYNDQALVFLDKKLNKLKIKNVSLVQSDIRKVNSLKLGKFDMIILSDVIEHINLIDAKALVASLKKMLKKNGVVSIITPNYNSLWTYLEKFLDVSGLVPKFDQEQHLSKFSTKLLNRIFKTNNFKVKRSFTFNLFSPLAPNKSLSYKLCSLEEKILGENGNLIFALYQFLG